MLDKSQAEIRMYNLGFKMYKKFIYLEHSFLFTQKMIIAATKILVILNISTTVKL